MRLLWEKYYPLTLSVVSTLAFAIFRERLNEVNFSNVSGSALIIFPVLLGFLLTVSTLLHTIRNDVMDFIREAGYYLQLIRYLNYSIKLSFIVSLASLLIPIFKNLIIDFSPFSVNLYPLAKLAYLFLVLLALLSCYRFIHLFLRIISSSGHGTWHDNK